MSLFDTHCHLDNGCFTAQLPGMIACWQACGVDRFLVPSVAPERWEGVLALCDRHPSCYPAIGIHPCFLMNFDESSLMALDDLIRAQKQIVALGEIGLDKTAGDWALQVRVFGEQVRLAMTHNLPVIIHSRHSHAEIVAVLKRLRFKGTGVVHGFSGSYEQAKEFIALNLNIGVGGVITYERARKTRSAITRLPAASLVLETDSPDMPVAGFQGSTNTPERLPIVAETLSFLRSESKDQLLAQLYANSCELFRIHSGRK